MGKQINFHFTKVDEKEFLSEIKKKGDFLIGDQNERYNLDEPDKLPRQVFIISVNSKIFIKETEVKKIKYIDSDSSEVIEYSRSEQIDSVITRGRIWAQISFWDLDYVARINKSTKIVATNNNKNLIQKEDWFKKKYEAYMRWIKKYCAKVKDKYGYLNYLGKDALKQVRENNFKIRARIDTPNEELIL